jgi:hypothetical protein
MTRVVSRYRNLQIQDCRDTIRVQISGFIPPAARLKLQDEGFKPKPGGIWEAPHTPGAIFAAENIGATFFGDAE